MRVKPTDDFWLIAGFGLGLCFVEIGMAVAFEVMRHLYH